VHWQTLEKMLAHEEPPGYRRQRPRAKPKIEAFLPIIEEILRSDQAAPRKQRHTAKRIWERLRDEHGFSGGLTIVQDAVREWKQSRREVFLPLSHPPGEAQVDFGFVYVKRGGQQQQVALFVLSLPYSDVVYCQVFPRECTEVFLEGHRRAFTFLQGVPRRIAYDNTKTAVAQIISSRERKVTREFQRLLSHCLFESHFCLVRRPNEKGHVERLLDYARENFLVPVPEVGSLAQLNRQLEDRCRADLLHHVRGKSGTKGDLLVEDQAAFLPLPAREFEARQVAPGVAVDSLSLVRFDTNSYSVPTKYAHRKVTVVATVDEVRLVYEDQLIARHVRCWEQKRTFYEPIHYLALLERKPGGLDYARPLEGWQLPSCFDLLRRRLEAADQRQGTRRYIRVLRLLERFALEQLTDAVEYALDIDVIDVDSVRVIVEYRADRPVEFFSLEGRPHLQRVRVETTDVSAYQTLLAEVQP
jgi:transposase